MVNLSPNRLQALDKVGREISFIQQEHLLGRVLCFFPAVRSGVGRK